MFKRLREQFSTAALILSAIAVLLAVAGGAMAASGALTGKQKKEVKAIAKSFQGTGPQGAPGTPGANGTSGKDGAPGAPGTPGKAGTDGKSVTVTKIDPGFEECEELGGALVEVESTPPGVEVCNGEEGAQGIEGQPWTFNSTLPTGATETGVWSFNGTAADSEGVYAEIGFPVQMAKALKRPHTHYATDADFETFCKGSYNVPVAPAGELCVYQSTVSNATFEGMYKVGPIGETQGALQAGTVLAFTMSGAGYGMGTWAVTGCANKEPLGVGGNCF